MALPILKMPTTDKPLVSLQGAFASPCQTCPLADVCVQGCCGSHGACDQTRCYRECNTCGGGALKEKGLAGTPAVCSKAPLRNLYLSQVRQTDYNFTPRSLIDLPHDSVIVGQGAPGVLKDPHPPGTHAVAVNLRHVWSSKGWFSADIRDYMRIEKGTKLILLTSMHDDVLERAWAQDIQHEDFARFGFDYWQALEFSQYASMSRFNNLWLGYRSLQAIEHSQAHFTCQFPYGLDHTKANGLVPWQKGAEAIPQVMLNWQFTKLKDASYFRSQIADVRRFMRHTKVQALWFCGVVSYAMVYAVTLNFPTTRCYFLSRNPFLAGQKGELFSEEGKLRKQPELSKAELSWRNQDNFRNLVTRAISDARNAVHQQRG